MAAPRTERTRASTPTGCPGSSCVSPAARLRQPGERSLLQPGTSGTRRRCDRLPAEAVHEEGGHGDERGAERQEPVTPRPVWHDRHRNGGRNGRGRLEGRGRLDPKSTGSPGRQGARRGLGSKTVPCPSGRRSMSRKHVMVQAIRGFKSHRYRREMAPEIPGFRGRFASRLRTRGSDPETVGVISHSSSRSLPRARSHRGAVSSDSAP